MYIYYWGHRHFFRWLYKICFLLDDAGAEHFPAEGPVIIASNHASFLDPVLIATCIPRQTVFLAKKELFSVPVLGWWFKSLGSYPVDRGGSDLRAVKTAMRLLKEGRVMIVFPEGTRCEDGEIQPFQEGMAWLALQTDAPITPIYIHGSNRAWGKRMILPRPAKIHLRIGPAIRPTQEERDMPRAEAIESITARVRETMLEMKETVGRLKGAKLQTAQGVKP